MSATLNLCSRWIEGSDVATCCDAESSDSTVFDDVAEMASELLFQFSGRRYPGICERTVRPCRTTCSCPFQVLSRGYVVWNPWMANMWGGYGLWSCDSYDWCGCEPLSRVLLAGYVNDIVEVVIDGDVVDPNTYRVDRHRWLVRTREVPDDPWPHWPGCQDLTLPEDQPGTWAVTYEYGKQPPIAGVEAAIELGCELYKLCQGLTCKLPTNTTRVIRQGLVTEKPAFFSWAFEKGGRSIPRGWKSGMPKVDAFLNAYNPAGLTRVPIFWSPTSYLRYAPPVDAETGT